MRARRAGAYWPSREQELLLRAALSAGTDAVQAWHTLRPRLDVDRADRASRQIFPLLGANLRRHGIDDPLAERLTAIRDDTASRNRSIFSAGRRLLLALADAGIDTLVLKGGALATGLYRDIGLRPMGDLDVLVPTARAEEALEVLGRAGWAPRTAITPAFIRMQHAGDLFAEADSVKCDLHWHVYWECCEPEADRALWASSVPLDFEGVPTRMLGPADQLLHLCVHGSRRARRPRILWATDVLLLLAGGIDWPRLLAQVAQRRFVLRAGTMLAYLRAAFAAPVPVDVLAGLETLPVSRLERFEYWVGNRRQGLLGELPSYWCNYRRLRQDWRTGPAPPAFPDYLQQIWRVDSLGAVVRGALARARRRARTAVFGQSAAGPPTR